MRTSLIKLQNVSKPYFPRIWCSWRMMSNGETKMEIFSRPQGLDTNWIERGAQIQILGMDLLLLISEDRLPSTFESSRCELGPLRDTGSHPQYSGTTDTNLNRRYVNQTSSTTCIICSMYTCVQKGTRRMAILLERQLLDHNLLAVYRPDRNQSLRAECHHFHYEKQPLQSS
jgi:hypothetical protein